MPRSTCRPLLLLFGQLVIVPLGLGLVAGAGPPVAVALDRAAWFGVRIGSVAAIAAVAIPRGELSAAVAALYLLPTLAIGGAALVRAAGGAVLRPPGLARTSAAAFLVVGAVICSASCSAVCSGGAWPGSPHQEPTTPMRPGVRSRPTPG